MKEVIVADPIFDEIWKLDVVTAPSIIERISSLSSTVAPGWAFVAKVFMWIFPDDLYASRIFTAFWILPAIVLVPLCFTLLNQSKSTFVILLCGAAYIGLSNPIQSAITYFNPYTFEIFYSALLLFLCARWEIFGKKGQWITLFFLSITPFFTFSTLFYLPFLYSMIFIWSENHKLKIMVIASAIVALGISAILYFFVYYAAAKSSYMLNFWDGDLATGSITRLFQLLADFPGQLINSLVPFNYLPFIAKPLGSSLLIILFGLIVLGIKYLYKINARMTMAILSASIVACIFSYFAPWPLSLSTPKNRVNLACLWPFYFAFGVGVSQLISSISPKIFQNKHYIYFIFLVAISPPINPYPYPVDKDRKIYSDIEKMILPDEKQNSVVFTVHYSSDSYVNHLLANRFPEKIVAVNIGHKEFTSEYLKNMRDIVANQVKFSLVYIVLPAFTLNQEIMKEVETLTLPGFILDKVTETESSQIRKFKKIDRKNMNIREPL